MGKNFSLHIEVGKKQRLVKEGPYRFLRHPGYLAVIFKAYYTLIYTLIIYIPLILFRAHLEEKILIERFGEEYISYKKGVFGFLPLRRLK